MSKKRQRKLYVFELEGNGFSYYVGHTSKSIDKVIPEHLRGDRALTRHNKPVKMLEVIDIGILEEHEAVEVVTNKVIELMNPYGVLEVRGGQFTFADDLTHLRQVASCLDSVRHIGINDLEGQLRSYVELDEIFHNLDLTRNAHHKFKKYMFSYMKINY